MDIFKKEYGPNLKTAWLKTLENLNKTKNLSHSIGAHYLLVVINNNKYPELLGLEPII